MTALELLVILVVQVVVVLQEVFKVQEELVTLQVHLPHKEIMVVKDNLIPWVVVAVALVL